MTDYFTIADMQERIRLELREMARKILKQSSKKELIEFILDNLDLLRTTSDE